MRHIHGRCLQPIVQRAQLAAHDVAEFGVQRAQWLVEQKRQGLTHDRPAQRHPLAVAARKPRYRAVEQMLNAQNSSCLLDARPHIIVQHAL